MIDKLPFRIRYERRKAYGVSMVSGFPNPTDQGECCPNKKEIKIKSGLSEKETVSTLTHEIFHLCNFSKDLNITEDQINGMELGFIKILELNQDYLELLYRTFKKKKSR